MPIIILEGPDGQGKTTLAKALCDTYNGYYMHASYHKKMASMMSKYIKSILHKAILLHQQGKLVVIDRLTISCIVYERVYRKSRNMRAMIELNKQAMLLLEANAALIFIVNHEANQALEYYKECLADVNRKEMYNDLDDFKRVIKVYDSAYYTLNKQVNYIKKVERKDFYGVINMIGNYYGISKS
jgi:thymidylate kinase